MRKLLITLVVLIALAATMSILWLFCGREISLFADRFGTLETSSTPISSLAYEGRGTGGVLLVNDLRLSLTPAGSRAPSPNVGTTKDNQLALSFGGKVFPFGPLRSAPEGSDELLATSPLVGDDRRVLIRHSGLSWIEPFKFNFMTGQSPSWKRHVYYQLVWKKPSGARLEMLWRYEQYFSPANGLHSEFMTREDSTGLIRIDIAP